jgi:hypothetical protein
MRETPIYDEKKLKRLKETAKKSVAAGDNEMGEFGHSADDIEIFDLQKEKQVMMNKLKDELKIIDLEVGELKGEGETNRDVQYREDGNFYIDNNGKLETASLGELVTDASYGIEYNLNSSEVPRDVLKKYAVGRARSRIRSKFDMQLLHSKKQEKEREGNKRAEMFKGVIEERESGEYDKNFEIKPGLIFERNMINMVKQLEYDMPGLDIKINEVDIMKDMDQKIDFIITVKNIPHSRAVEVNESDKLEEKESKYGIQFTINPEATKQKMKQIERSIKYDVKDNEKINDLLLVTVPAQGGEVAKNYREWKKDGMKSGGPEKQFSNEVKIDFLKQLLDKIGKENIIGKNKNNLEEYYNKKK